jgi:nitrite reductase (NAD(P)H)
MVLHRIEAMGVQVMTNCSPTAQLTHPADDGPSNDIFTGFVLQDGTTCNADLAIYAIGIQPRDQLAKTSGIECNAKCGIVVDDYLETSAKDVYAIGECASWQGNTYGLIAPGSAPLQISRLCVFIDSDFLDNSRNGRHTLFQSYPDRISCL